MKRKSPSSPHGMQTRSKTDRYMNKMENISRGPERHRKHRKVTTMTTGFQSTLFTCDHCGLYTESVFDVCTDCKDSIAEKTSIHLYTVIVDIVAEYL